jgi:hypothetical protein
LKTKEDKRKKRKQCASKTHTKASYREETEMLMVVLYLVCRNRGKEEAG